MNRILASVGRAFLPQRLRPVLRRLARKVQNLGWKRQCSCCGSFIRKFHPHGQPPEDDFLCPVCRSKPPHRLASILFDKHPEWFKAKGLLVHVAPEDELSKKLAITSRRSGMRYRCGGITGEGEFYLDLLHLPFSDGSVDLLYCCHVLNMVENDLAAMREVHRVMAADGVALLQVPAFYKGDHSLESKTPEESMRLFRDSSMFRIYSDADYISRLESVGFFVRKFVASDLPGTLIEKHQLKNEVLHACFKQRPDGIE